MPFRLCSKIRGSLCSARELLAHSAVSVKVKGQGEGQTLAIFFKLVNKLLCCAYASYCTESKGLLTDQALLLSQESLLRQQASGPSFANALVLCSASLRYLDTTSQSWPVMPNTQGVTAIIVYVFRVPHSCQVGALLSALFHCHRPVAFTGAIHALQALFASEVVHKKGVLVDLLCEPNTGLDRTAACAQSCASH